MHSEKVGAFRANKSQKGGGAFFAAHTRTALIYGSTLRGLLKMFERGWGWGSDSLEVLGNSKFIGLSLYHM